MTLKNKVECPYCNSFLIIDTSTDQDGYTTVKATCMFDCGITIDFGEYGPGVTEKEIEQNICKITRTSI